MAGAFFFFGVSTTMASVVIMRPAIEEASCRLNALASVFEWLDLADR
jgi:hypothetical protein